MTVHDRTRLIGGTEKSTCQLASAFCLIPTKKLFIIYFVKSIDISLIMWYNNFDFADGQ